LVGPGTNRKLRPGFLAPAIVHSLILLGPTSVCPADFRAEKGVSVTPLAWQPLSDARINR
jgi:hypothetical protein